MSGPGGSPIVVAPGHSDEAHPAIFNTIPPQAKPLKPGQLTDEQLNQFFEDVSTI